jgi:uncharacterized membrane protein
VNTNRLEAFSDGVLAVAITLLVLDIKVPLTSHHDLAHQLAEEWPEYAAYVTSFITIGIIWMNHHAMIGRLRRADHAILFWNLLLLLTVGLLPFATALVATYLKQGHGEAHLAAAVYGGSLLLMSLVFAALNRQILLVRSDLLEEAIPERRRRAILAAALKGIVPYAIATALAVVSAYATLAICAAVAAYYAHPRASGG